MLRNLLFWEQQREKRGEAGEERRGGRRGRVVPSLDTPLKRAGGAESGEFLGVSEDRRSWRPEGQKAKCLAKMVTGFSTHMAQQVTTVSHYSSRGSGLPGHSMHGP